MPPVGITFQRIIDEAVRHTPLRTPSLAGVIADPVYEESHRLAVFERLARERAALHSARNRLHIGVAGFFNFEIAQLIRPAALLLIDKSRDQVSFWKSVVGLLRQCETPALFAKAYRDAGLEPSALAWLGDEGGYGHLRRLALNGGIATTEIDLLEDRDRAASIGYAIRHRAGLRAGTAYWSNVASFHLPQDGLAVSDAKYVSTAHDLFGNPHFKDAPTTEIEYGVMGYRDRLVTGRSFWDGRRVAGRDDFDTLPPFERMAQTTSDLGGSHGMHIMTQLHDEIRDLREKRAPLIVTDGPLRRPSWLSSGGSMELGR